ISWRPLLQVVKALQTRVAPQSRDASSSSSGPAISSRQSLPKRRLTSGRTQAQVMIAAGPSSGCRSRSLAGATDPCRRYRPLRENRPCDLRRCERHRRRRDLRQRTEDGRREGFDLKIYKLPKLPTAGNQKSCFNRGRWCLDLHLVTMRRDAFRKTSFKSGPRRPSWRPSWSRERTHGRRRRLLLEERCLTSRGDGDGLPRAENLTRTTHGDVWRRRRMERNAAWRRSFGRDSRRLAALLPAVAWWFSVALPSATRTLPSLRPSRGSLRPSL
ncbi:unnamed protein product, partial [Closterium sp. NIES-53]